MAVYGVSAGAKMELTVGTKLTNAAFSSAARQFLPSKAPTSICFYAVTKKKKKKERRKTHPANAEHDEPSACAGGK